MGTPAPSTRTVAMRAMVLRNKELTIQELDRPVPGPGQVLVRVRASGICGSDLHVARFMEDMIEALAALGDGSIAAGPLVTRTISLDELPGAFAALADPHDCKVVATFP